MTESIHSFQFTDAEDAASKGVVPDSVRRALRRPNEEIATTTTAWRKAYVVMKLQNDVIDENRRNLRLQRMILEETRKIAELEGAAVDAERLRREKEALARTVEARDLEIERIKNRQLAAEVRPALAVNS